MKLKYLIFLIFILSINAYGDVQIEFPADKDCVAWKTKKVMGLVKTVEPIGINCEITVTVTTHENGLKSVEILAPIAKFNSQEPDRDAEVNKILGAETQPNLVLRAVDLDANKMRQENELSGVNIQITRANANHTLLANISKKGDGKFHVIVKTSFSQLGLKPPSIFGGLVAQVSDTLVLEAQILDREELK